MKKLPMFPLGSVLFPGGLLPLHVFEPRYRALMEDLIGDVSGPDDPAAGHDREFGVVLIERGSEVGGGDRRSRIGTVAQLKDWQRLPDGRWVTVALGMERIHVAEWLPDDPFPQALVEPLPDEEASMIAPSTLREAERQVRRSLALAAELGHEVAPVTFALPAGEVQALWHLCATAPLGPLDAQQLLEERSAATRARRLASAVEELASVLAFRLSGG